MMEPFGFGVVPCCSRVGWDTVQRQVQTINSHFPQLHRSDKLRKKVDHHD